MGKTLCICNQKGGAGKTSLTHNVGTVLATEYDRKVLFVDVDGQANLTTAFGFDPDDMSNNIAAVLTQKQITTGDFIVETPIKNSYLIPSNQETFAAEKLLYDRNGREFVLNDVLDQVRDHFDYIFIDTPPNLGIITLNALIAANGVIFVYTASDFSLDGLSQILNTLDEIRANRRLNVNNTNIAGAVLNRYRSTNKTVNSKLSEALNGVTDIPMYFTPISDTTEIEKAQFEHKPITLFNPRHKVSEEFRQFAKEVLEWHD